MRDSKVRARGPRALLISLGLAVGLAGAWTVQAGPDRESKGHSGGEGGHSRPAPRSSARPSGMSRGASPPSRPSGMSRGTGAMSRPSGTYSGGGGMSRPGGTYSGGGGMSRPGGTYSGGGAPSRPGGTYSGGGAPSRPGGMYSGGGARPQGMYSGGSAGGRPNGFGATGGNAGAFRNGLANGGRPGAFGAGMGVARPGGGSFGGHAAPGGRQQFASNGSGIQRRADGRVADVHDVQRGVDVHHGLDGSSHSVRALPGGGRIVATRGGAGYVQHAFYFRGHDFGHRTYFAQGRVFDRFYGGYSYRGRVFDVYARDHYFPVGFYAYASSPWAAPAAYSWPSFPFGALFGHFFRPFGLYAGPVSWLADALIATSLLAAYDAQQQPADPADTGPLQAGADDDQLAANGPGPVDTQGAPESQAGADAPSGADYPGEADATSGAGTLSAPVKEQVVAEVQGILRQAQTEAQTNAAGQEVDPTNGNIVKLFSDGRTHVLLAGATADVVSSTGQECAITAGDVLSVDHVGADNADAHVLAVKNGGQECPMGATVSVAVSDLQDMYNFMREGVDAGLQDLQNKGGSAGLPPTPVNAAGGHTQALFAQGAPPPEADAGQQVAAEYAAGAAAEKEVTASVAPGGT